MVWPDHRRADVLEAASRVVVVVPHLAAPVDGQAKEAHVSGFTKVNVKEIESVDNVEGRPGQVLDMRSSSRCRNAVAGSVV
jgi:hypothetical protein